jgi:predicted O-methyltransferase YrrM
MSEFGGSGITAELFDWIVANVPQGSTMLELGAGYVSTKFLSQKYKLYSVEDKAEFLNIFSSTYIYAPIDTNKNWYHRKALEEDLPKEYDCILVDGPTGEGNRWGFLENLDLFRPDVLIIVDDTWRKAEKEMLVQLAEKTNRRYELFENFGVLHI